MTEQPSHPLAPRTPALALHASSALPVWLWSVDGTRILWANPVGAAIFGARDAHELAARRFDASLPTATQIARLAGTLSHSGAARLERLRGFGTGVWRALLCTCSRVPLADHTRAVLVVATEPAGPSLSLAERARRLVEGCRPEQADVVLAVFAPDGALLHANAAEQLGAAPSLARLGIEQIGAQALATGRASGASRIGPVDIMRLGAGSDRVLAAAFTLDNASQPRVEAPYPETAIGVTNASAPPQPAAAADAGTASAAPASDAPPAAPVAASTDPLQPPSFGLDVRLADRRHPLRFVWQMDADGRFTIGSDEFTEVIGPNIATALGRPWSEVASELALDPEHQVERAVATRDTWSGLTISWPVDGTDDRLKVEMSGLPIYDRNRVFVGYRGFGVCRDVERINVLAQMRRNAPILAAVPEAPAPREQTGEPVSAEPVAGRVEPEQAPDAQPEQRAPLTLVPSARNVVPFRSAGANADGRKEAVGAAPLSPVERNAFRELARQLTARLKGEHGEDLDDLRRDDTAEAATEAQPEHRTLLAGRDSANATPGDRPLLERLPFGILVYRFDHLLYANRAFLAWTGHADLQALSDAGGLDALLLDGAVSGAGEIGGEGKSITIAANGDKPAANGRLFSVAWNGEPALALVLNGSAGESRAQAADGAAAELRAMFDGAPDPMLVLDRDARILSCNRAAPALFGRDADRLTGTLLTDLLAPDSRRPVMQDLDALTRASGTIEPREIAAPSPDGGQTHLLITMTRLAGGNRFCAVLHDITSAKASERELVLAREQASKALQDKFQFLARIAHEVRTPLNSIIGFSEVMLEEQFGPIGNERYREYLKDIRASGTQAASLLSDLLDLAKIESGQLDLTFVGIHLNEMVQSCVALMQPQANRDQIIVRTSLLPSLRPVVADARSVRQIVLNLLSNSFKFTPAGGQVIISTASTDDGRVVLRVRDTGIGMSESDLAAAVEPFAQQTTARWGSARSGLTLPLTRALAQANHAAFAISSKVNEGTLVEIAFPATRVLAD